jgi:beta-phosphoglucomutase
MKLKALCIDLDGTLIDTLPALYQVYLKFMAHFGKKGTEEEFKGLIGPSIDEIVAILGKKHKLPESPEELSVYYVSLLMMQGFQGTELYPNAKNTLEGLKKAGVKLAIVTSGTKPLVKACLDPLHIEPMFDAVITAESVKQTKPHPDLYQTALKTLSVAPQEAVAVEDSSEGKAAALKAGLSVLMLTHKEPKPATPEKGVTYVKDWTEIGKWLQQK